MILNKIESYTEESNEVEKEKLKRASPLTIIEYIKSSIEILIDLKAQEKLEEKEYNRHQDKSYSNNLNIGEDETNEYEKLLRKLEADIRCYIKV